MGITIRFNLGSSLISNSLSANYLSLMKPLERLSSGLSINRASDGPAALAISEQLRTQIASLNQEIENTSTMIGKYETGSSYVSELRSKLTELRSLAVGAANEGGNSESAQVAYAATSDYILSNYNNVIDTAEYNGMNLLDGSEGSLAKVDQLEGIDLSSAESAQESIAVIDSAIEGLDEVQVDLGATQRYELEAHHASLQVTLQNLEAAQSQLRDTDYAQEYSTFLGEMIKFQANAALLAHWSISANTVLNLLSG